MKCLNLMAPINSLGYGVAGLNILKSLSQKYNISLFTIGPASCSTQEEQELVSNAIKNSTLFAQEFADAPCLKVWHEFALAERIGKGPCFGFPFFELDQLDQRRINHLSSVDGIIVASHWAKEIIKAHVPIPPLVGVAPLGVDTTIFTHGPHTTTDKCVFLNCGKWEKRKGHDLLLEMFRSAFPDEQDVELWMMSHNTFLAPGTPFAKQGKEWERYYQSDLRVKLIGRVQTHKEVAAIMSQANCGVFPSRAEGWNLELLEMLSMGKPVIATNYSAHTEFCTKENSYLIDIENTELAKDDIFFDGSGGEWASLDGVPFDQGVEYLRSFYESWKKEPQQVNMEGIETAKKFSWTNPTNRIEEIIDGNRGQEN